MLIRLEQGARPFPRPRYSSTDKTMQLLVHKADGRGAVRGWVQNGYGTSSAKILKPADIADMTLAIAKLPPLAHVPELVIKPIGQSFI